MKFSASELLALAAIGHRAPREQQDDQSAVIAEFSETESLPSCELVARKKWRRLQDARAKAAARKMGMNAA